MDADMDVSLEAAPAAKHKHCVMCFDLACSVVCIVSV